MSEVVFMFPAMCARDVHPINNEGGVTVAEVEFKRGRYTHADSHTKGGYDELCLHQLSSGSEPAGRILQSDGAGGAIFTEVPSLLVARGQYYGKRVQYRIPTIFDRISIPHLGQASTLSPQGLRATLTGRGPAKWRLYDASQRSTLAEGVSNVPQDFSVVSPSGSAPLELHVWLDETDNDASDTVKIDEFRLVSMVVAVV